MGVVSLKGSLLLMAFLIHTVLTAPVIEENTALLGPDQIAEGTGCYYNYEHYDEGDRILTNEPCLNCTCHNRMLMCYLRVCPFTKAIGQDCKIEKKPDQCCPVITCPQVPVALLTSSTTETTASTTTAVGHPDNYGCVLDDNIFYPDGAQVPSNPRKPCELCYCIRNQTACVMQECTLNVEGCKPVYQEGVCCPVRYDCDYDEVLTTPRPTAGLVTTPGGPTECSVNDRIFKDGEMIENMTENPCEHCYCMRGDVVCAVQECGTPLENTECTPLPAEPGQCCPSTYQCPNGTIPARVFEATPHLKPSPPVAPSLAQIKPEAVTEISASDDKTVDGTEPTNDERESDNVGVEQQEPEKNGGHADSTIAESSEVITEAPKEQAIIEIITTDAPLDVAEVPTHTSSSENLQTGEQHPEIEQESPSVPDIVPEHDQVEEVHPEEEHVLEGHVEDGHDTEIHNVEATTVPGHYTEISVENVEMNTSLPEVAKPEIPSASHSSEETEYESVHTEGPLEITTVGSSSQIKEPLPQNSNEEVNIQQVEHDASGQPETHDAISETGNQEGVSQQDDTEVTAKPENQEAVSHPENQEAVSQPENQEAVSQPENQHVLSQPESQDALSQPENHDVATQDENQQPLSQPDAQPEIQETTMRPEIQEVINQLDNQGAGSQQDKLETIQPENQEVNQDSSDKQEIVSSPTEPTPSSQMPQEPLPQENEKLSAVSELPETTPAPISSTTTTEAEPEEMPRIPGEGSCLHKGITYPPNTEVPSTNACKRCRCENSIVQCNDLECPEPPIALYSNCVPMPPTDDACCPTYFCEQKPSQEPEVDSMSIDKIDQGIEELAPEEGIAPTTVASVHEDVPAIPENFVPGTHEIMEHLNTNFEEGSQPESPASEDAEEVKPSGGELQPESVIPSGEESIPESDVPSEGYPPAAEVPQPESVDPLPEASQPESSPTDSEAQPQFSVDITTALPAASSDLQGSTALEQHEASPHTETENVHPVSQDIVESESVHDAEATTKAPSEVISEEQGNKLEEAQSISEVPEITAVEEQVPVTESPQRPAEEPVSFDGSESGRPEPEKIEVLSQPEHEESHEDQESQDAVENEKLEETIQTTATPVEKDSNLNQMENIQEKPESQHGDITNQETNNGEAHDGQEPTNEDESNVSDVTNTDAPSLSTGEHGAGHDSEQSGSSQPVETEPVPTIDQGENDLTATPDSAPESPTTAIPDENSSVHAQYNETQLPSTEGPSGASENPEIPEPLVTSGPPVLFPDISHQGAPIHIPGPTGINPDSLTSEAERLGETETPIQEHSQTEKPQAPEESSSSGDVQGASEVSEGGIKEDIVYTTEGLNVFSHQTEGDANGYGSGAESEADSESNQITESSQSNAANNNANEISEPEHEPALSGEESQGQVEEAKDPEGAEPAEVSESATETPQEPIQPTHDETEVQPTHDETEVRPTHDETEVQPTHDETEVQPTHDNTVAPDAHSEQTHDESEAQPTHDESEAQPAHVESEAQPTHDESEAQPTHFEPEAQPTHGESEAQPTHADSEQTHEESEAQPTHDESMAQPTHDESEAQPTHDESEAQPTHDESEAQPTHDESEAQPTHGESEAQPTHDESEALPTHDESEAQPTHDESEAQPTHDESESQPTHEETHNETEVHVSSAAEQQVGTDVPVSEKDVTEAPLAPVVTHGDLPTPSEPSPENVISSSSETEIEKKPDTSETHQSQDVEVSASQPAVESHGHEGVEPEIEHPQEVTQTPENDEVVTHIDSAGPQKVPEIANQVVETDTNAIEHATGVDHGEPSTPIEDGKIGAEEAAIPAEDHLEQEKPSTPEEHYSAPIEAHHSDSVMENQEHSDVAPAEHPAIATTEHQVLPESDHVPTSEDHSEGHTGSVLSESHNLEESQEQGTEQPVSEIPSEQTQPEEQHPEMAQTGGEHGEMPGAGEALSEPSGPQGEIVETQPGVTHDENLPEQPVVEDHVEQVEPHHEEPHEDHIDPNSEIIGEQPHTTSVPERLGSSQDSEAQPEQQNVVSSQQVEEEAKPSTSESSEIAEDGQQTATQQESGSGFPITDGQAPEAEENIEHVPLSSHDSAPAATGEEQTQTAPPVKGEIGQAEDVTAVPEHSEVIAENQQPSAEAEKDVGLTMETTPAVQHEDLHEETHEQPLTPEGQPNEAIAQLPEGIGSEPSGSESPSPTPEEVPIESAPSAPSVPEQTPSAPQPLAPEEPSAPEGIVPEAPSAPESVVSEHPSAPEYTAPEQPSAPEQPAAPETLPSLGQDEIPVPQESDIPSQPDQSSQLVEEIEKEQPIPETSSSPIAELSQSSPLPPVEIPSTEGPVLPPGLQTWSQKPYHPPSIPEQHHHTTAEVPHLPEDSHYPSQPYDQDYEDDDNVSYGPGTCRYGGKVYLSAQQIPRDDPCDFCFCFRSDIICLQQSCPPPIRGCYQETIKGFCCPRYECHVSMATMVNITTTSTTTTTTVPPHFLSHHYNGSAMKAGCQVKGIAYRVGDRIPSTSGPCLDCRCGANGQMKCDPTICGPQESLLRQVMAASASKRRRR